MPFDENPEDPVHVRIRRRLDTAFDSELLVEIGISPDGECGHQALATTVH